MEMNASASAVESADSPESSLSLAHETAISAIPGGTE
jgi:citrate synthase